MKCEIRLQDAVHVENSYCPLFKYVLLGISILQSTAVGAMPPAQGPTFANLSKRHELKSHGIGISALHLSVDRGLFIDREI